MTQFAYVPPAQYSASWPHGELHRRPQWQSVHASPPPNTVFRGPKGTPWKTIPTIAVLTTAYGWVLCQ
eukprot:1422225-Pyramimonas_sp.AAC.1